MVDANDSKSFVARRARSSRARGTTAILIERFLRSINDLLIDFVDHRMGNFRMALDALLADA